MQDRNLKQSQRQTFGLSFYFSNTSTLTLQFSVKQLGFFKRQLFVSLLGQVNLCNTLNNKLRVYYQTSLKTNYLQYMKTLIQNKGVFCFTMQNEIHKKHQGNMCVHASSNTLRHNPCMQNLFCNTTQKQFQQTHKCRWPFSKHCSITNNTTNAPKRELESNYS